MSISSKYFKGAIPYKKLTVKRGPPRHQQKNINIFKSLFCKTVQNNTCHFVLKEMNCTLVLLLYMPLYLHIVYIKLVHIYRTLKWCIFFVSGLPLVVEKFHSFWGFSFLYFSLFIILFYNKVRNNRIYTHIIIHRLYRTYGIDFLASNRYHRILSGICICEKNI